jgi:small subunit ribosomal protein S16
MLKIRLQRTGRSGEKTFRLVLTESKNATRSGKFLEVLGNHDFRNDKTEIKTDRVKHWMGLGAQPTPTVHNLFISEKVITGKKINVLPKKTPPVKEAPKDAPKAPEAPKVEATPAPEAAAQ